MRTRIRFPRPSPLHLGLALSLIQLDPNGVDATPTASTRFVSSCLDDGTAGTLRFEIEYATSGDTIDAVTQLPAGCTDIMLQSQIEFIQNDLTIIGAGPGSLAIDGGHAYRVFMHLGGGTLAISGISIKNGYYSAGLSDGDGGCIFSGGSVSLNNTVISDCDVHALHTTKTARGGGIFTAKDLTLLESTITGSASRGWFSLGGGAYVRGNLYMHDSEVAGNTSTSTPGFYARGGGIEAAGDVTIDASTIAGNRSEAAAALDLSGGGVHMASLTNATVSSNVAATLLGGIWSNVSLKVENSTIAFNRSLGSPSPSGSGANGIFSFGAPIKLRSSIVAGNRGIDGPNDVAGMNGAVVTLSSANNLVTASALELPLDTLTTCPRLDALANRGGASRTHVPLSASPVLDRGSNPLNLAEDQRSAIRTFGTGIDIGSVERQDFDADDRIHSDGFDGACDE